MKAAACCAISSIEVGTSPLELETPALLNKITSRSRANPSVNAGSQRSMVAVKCISCGDSTTVEIPAVNEVNIRRAVAVIVSDTHAGPRLFQDGRHPQISFQVRELDIGFMGHLDESWCGILLTGTTSDRDDQGAAWDRVDPGFQGADLGGPD